MRGFSRFFLIFLAVALGADDNKGASIKKRWIRTNFDADGYFLLQVEIGTDRWGDVIYSCLTADNDSSVTIEGMYTANIYRMVIGNFIGNPLSA